jgi:hypothetical protein
MRIIPTNVDFRYVKFFRIETLKSRIVFLVGLYYFRNYSIHYLFLCSCGVLGWRCAVSYVNYTDAYISISNWVAQPGADRKTLLSFLFLQVNYVLLFIKLRNTGNSYCVWAWMCLYAEGRNTNNRTKISVARNRNTNVYVYIYIFAIKQVQFCELCVSFIDLYVQVSINLIILEYRFKPKLLLKLNLAVNVSYLVGFHAY